MTGKPHGARYTGVWIPAFAGMTGGRGRASIQVAGVWIPAFARNDGFRTVVRLKRDCPVYRANSGDCKRALAIRKALPNRSGSTNSSVSSGVSMRE